MVDQALARIGVDQLFHQLVDGRVAQADEVAAARVVGGAAAPVFALLVARRVGLREAADDHVVVTRAQAGDVLRDIDAANVEVDAQVGKVTLEWQQDALELGLREQELDHHRLALGVDHLVVDDLPAGFLQQLVGLALLLADHAAAIADRVVEGLAEDLIRNLAAQRLEDLQLIGAGQAAGSHFRVLEEAAGAGVGAVEQLLVGPFVVQQLAQRLAHAHVLEQRATDVEDEALHPGGVTVGQLFLDQAAFTNGRHVVGAGPVFCADFQGIVEGTGFQCFQGDGGVAVGVESHGVEVIETAVDRQVLGPVVLYPLVTDAAPGLDLGNLVRPAAQRDFQVAAVEFAVFVPVLGQHWQLAEDQRQLAVVVVLEPEQHPQRVFGNHFGDVAVVLAVERGAILDQGIEGEHHILGAHRVAIVEARFGAQVETHPAIVRGFLDLAGDQAVLGERLVLALTHQGVVDDADVFG